MLSYEARSAAAPRAAWALLARPSRWSPAAPGPGAWPACAWSIGWSRARRAALWGWSFTPRRRWRPHCGSRTDGWWRRSSVAWRGSPSATRHPVRSMKVRAHGAGIPLAEEFTIARATRSTADVVRVEVEHDGLTGRGEAAPIYYRGETVESALAFLGDEVPALLQGLEPFDLEAVGDAAVERRRGGGGARRPRRRPARLGRPPTRRAPLAPPRTRPATGPPPRTRSGIDTLEGTRDRARRAPGTRCSR